MRASRRRYGCTVGGYVRRLRLEYARHLLESSHLPLVQVALDAGFCDQGHLSRLLTGRPSRFVLVYLTAEGVVTDQDVVSE